MSRIGIKPIIADGATIEITPTELLVSGSLGKLTVALPHGITITEKDGKYMVDRVSDAKQYRALHGTVRALLQNAVQGVTKGFDKKMEMVGIGYRAALEGNDLVLQVGFTHPVRVAIPEGLKVTVEKNIITVSGHDKHRIGQFCADLRAIRKPDPYKGKGIRYQGEVIRMKQGKAAKAGA